MVRVSKIPKMTISKAEKVKEKGKITKVLSGPKLSNLPDETPALGTRGARKKKKDKPDKGE